MESASGSRRDWVRDARESYDRVAEPYAELTELAFDRLPLESSLTDHFAAQVPRGAGPVLDVGCGPGWLTGRISARGLTTIGLDVSMAMLQLARDRHPGGAVVAGSLTDLPVADGAVAGVLCWYVLHHVPDDDLPRAVGELARVVAPGGRLLLGGHVGDSATVKTEGYGGHAMRVLVVRRGVERHAALLRDVGLVVDATVSLGPQHPATAAVWLAHRPP